MTNQVRRIVPLCIVAIFILAGCKTEPLALPEPVDLVIIGAHVLDGRGGTEARHQTIVVDEGMITAVLGADQSYPRSEKVIDAGGGFLLPGFIDAHAHLLIPRCQSYGSGQVIFDRELSKDMLGVLLDFGITSIRSPANPTVAGLQLRDDLNEGRIRGPQAKASAEFLNDAFMSEEELRTYVREAMAYAPDYFKVYAALSPTQVNTVIDEAHAHKVPVIGHLGKTSWLEGAELDIDYLTHAVDWSEKTLEESQRGAYNQAKKKMGSMRARLDWLELIELSSKEVEAMIEALVAHGVVVDPTLVAYGAKFSRRDDPRYRENANVDVVPALRKDWIMCRGYADTWTDEDFAKWRRLFPKLQRLVFQMHERGVKLITGSDTPNEWVIPGESLHQEFELLAEAGIPAHELLRMTGAGAAQGLGWQDRGVIDAEHRADLVLLSKNPLEDITNTRSIRWVMQAGVIVSKK